MQNNTIKVTSSFSKPAHKFCVFCGKKPTNKNLEHVVPEWLIKLTGDRKRQVLFGPFWNEKTRRLEKVQLSFDQLKFPSCQICNEKYSALENQAMPVVYAMLHRKPLGSKDFSVLLSWLDKLRIGLWLGTYYLHRKVSDIAPHMFIESRLDLSDRAVLIYASDNKMKYLILPGTDTLLLQYLPCCFTVLINDLALFNIATDFLFSRRIGLPYPDELWWDEEPKILYSIVPGAHRVRLPLIRWIFNMKSVQLYQPMFTRPDIRGKFPELYDNDYVRSIATDFDKGLGRVFFHCQRTLTAYPDSPSTLWIPQDIWNGLELEQQIIRQTLRFQLHMLDEFSPKQDNLPPKRKALIRRQLKLAKEISMKLLKGYG